MGKKYSVVIPIAKNLINHVAKNFNINLRREKDPEITLPSLVRRAKNIVKEDIPPTYKFFHSLLTHLPIRLDKASVVNSKVIALFVV